jgi:hypothetical protein
MQDKIDSMDLFQKSLIIASHPDDEILWFSSILEKVNDIALCFLGKKDDPTRQVKIQRSLSEYPLKNVSCFGVGQSSALFGVNWQKLTTTEYGIEISKKSPSEKVYKANYLILKEHLANTLADYHNVFTHNPWGEYGHPEHIQIYRVVKDLQKDMKFNLWFSNYCSNLSYKLMLDFFDQFNELEYISLKTNNDLINDIKMLYMKNYVWTWYDDWEWFKEESFIKDNSTTRGNKSRIKVPLNFMSMQSADLSEKKDNTVKMFIKKVARKTGLGMVLRMAIHKRQIDIQGQ